MGHDYQVPVDKHDSDKKIPNPPDPLGGVKGRIFKFRYNSESCHYFTEISHSYRGTKIRNISNVIFDRRPVSVPLRLRGWGQKVKIQLFQNTVMMHIKLMRITNAATW